MAKPFDITTKQLISLRPTDWLRLAGLEGDHAEIENVDLSMIGPAADSVLRVHGASEYLANIEFQASYDASLPDRGLLYEVVLDRRDGLPIETVMILLRPDADGPAMSGVLHKYRPNGELKLEFRYIVIRLWEVPVEEVLASGLTTLAIAPLAAGAATDLPAVLQRIEERVAREMPAEERPTFWAATYILMGLKYPKDMIARVIRGVRDMRESVTYQAILEEGEKRGEKRGERKGELKGERNSLLLVGRTRLGEPPTWALQRINAERSKSALEALLARVVDVESWDELLGSGT